MLTSLIAAALLTQSAPIARFNATLTSPGGDLPFQLELSRDSASIINGQERIEVPTVHLDASEVRLRFDHYDSEIVARWQGDTLIGQWTKVGARGKLTVLPFRAAPPDRAPTLIEPVDRTPLQTRHTVTFASSDDPAVLLIDYEDTDDPVRSSAVVATFMTTTGDYRFLGGRLVDLGLTLSVFDGAHAFLFKATMNEDGGFTGDFWSRDTWHETWTSTPDPDAHLPDAFTQTTWNEGANLSDLIFADLNGTPTSVASLRDSDQPMIIKVFGSWCPNCHDAGVYLAELAERFPDVAFVGLAFEHTDDLDRSIRQVRAYAQRHDIDFPILVAGLSSKDKATEQLAALDRVRSFPTTIFIDRAGRVRAVHTGFTGPATGRAYDDLRAEFERLIDEIRR